MGLTGVEGKGCRYSGCRMCPDRAVSIFKSLMGTRWACRAGSDGGAGWRKGLPTLLFRVLLLCRAEHWSLYLRADADGVVIMSQLSAKETARLSSDTLRKFKKHRALLFRKDFFFFLKTKRIAKRSNNPGREGARRGSWRETVRGLSRIRGCASHRERCALCASVCRSSLCTPEVRTGRKFHFKSSWISPRLKPLPPSNQMGPRGDWRVKGMWRSPLCKRLHFDSSGEGGGFNMVVTVNARTGFFFLCKRLLRPGWAHVCKHVYISTVIGVL